MQAWSAFFAGTKIANDETKIKFMQNKRSLMHSLPGSFAAVLALFLFAGCKTETSSGKMASTPPPATAVPAPAAVPAATAAPDVAAASVPAPVAPPVRIKAGLTGPFTDSESNVWLPDQGFADGDTTERATDLQIANTKDPALYRTEHYSMTSFSYPVPNGKYIVKLHFAETFDGISGPGDRVFSFNAEGQDFKDFDIWVKAGGPNKAYIETVPVDVTDGKLDITFTPKVENPEINGIEILPTP
jgi:hypothetical protein